jgi:hypothetical protein
VMQMMVSSVNGVQNRFGGERPPERAPA